MNSQIKISPSLLAADFANLEQEVKKIEAAGADMLHLDVMTVTGKTLGENLEELKNGFYEHCDELLAKKTEGFARKVSREDIIHSFDNAKGTDVFHTTPVDTVNDLHGAFVIPGFNQFVDLSQLDAKLLFIQNIHQLSIIRISLPYAYGLVKTL